MAYDIDRDPSQQPSLEEMTRKAIEKLSQNPNGFFLMVEGSKVDWAAHANDPVGMATDMLLSTVLAVLPSNLPVRMARLP